MRRGKGVVHLPNATFHRVGTVTRTFTVLQAMPPRSSVTRKFLPRRGLALPEMMAAAALEPPVCPNCATDAQPAGLALERGEAQDFWIGAFAINLVVAWRKHCRWRRAVMPVVATWPSGTLAYLGRRGAGVCDAARVLSVFAHALAGVGPAVFRPRANQATTSRKTNAPLWQSLP